MKKEQFTLKSSLDNLQLGVLLIEPEGTVRGVVQLLHGMSEHKERYVPFMEFLCAHGMACIIHDHRGHGESVRSKKDLGYFYENGAMAIVEDVNVVNRYARKRYRDLPIYMFAHSMGTLVARSYLKQHDRVIDGVILSGSPSNNKLSKIAISLAKVACLIEGDTIQSTRFENIVFGTYNHKFGKVNSKNAWICANEESVQAYDESELCGFTFTNNGFMNLFKLLNWAYDEHNWHVNNEKLPIWFISGEEDPCRTDEKHWIETVKHMEKVGYKNVSCHLYKGMRHELLNETQAIKVYKDVMTKLEIWMDRPL